MLGPNPSSWEQLGQTFGKILQAGNSSIKQQPYCIYSPIGKFTVIDVIAAF